VNTSQTKFQTLTEANVAALTTAVATAPPTPIPAPSGPGSGSSAANAAASCRTIIEDHSVSTSGTYWITANGQSSAFQAYCDMDTGGGGWTRVLSITGSLGGWYGADQSALANVLPSCCYSDSNFGTDPINSPECLDVYNNNILNALGDNSMFYTKIGSAAPVFSKFSGSLKCRGRAQAAPSPSQNPPKQLTGLSNDVDCVTAKNRALQTTTYSGMQCFGQFDHGASDGFHGVSSTDTSAGLLSFEYMGQDRGACSPHPGNGHTHGPLYVCLPML
jgi:hypothetical protein